MDLIEQINDNFQFCQNNLLSSEDWDNEFSSVFDLDYKDFGIPLSGALNSLDDAYVQTNLNYVVPSPEVDSSVKMFVKSDFYDTSWESSDSGDSGFHSTSIKSEPSSPGSTTSSLIEVTSGAEPSPQIDLNDLITFDESSTIHLNANQAHFTLRNEQPFIHETKIEYSADDIPIVNIIETETVVNNLSLPNTIDNLAGSIICDEIDHNVVFSHNPVPCSMTYSVESDNNINGNSYTVRSCDMFSTMNQELKPFSNKNKSAIDELMSFKVVLRPKPCVDLVNPTETCIAMSRSISPNDVPSKKCTKRSLSTSSSEAHMDAVELKAYKKRVRMMKNRESATHSRMRQKQHLTDLQEQLGQYAEQNRILTDANKLLRLKVDQLQTENKILLSKSFIVSAPSVKTAACLLTICFLVSLNIGAMIDIIPRKSNDLELSIPQDYIRRGRTLKSLSELVAHETNDINVSMDNFTLSDDEMKPEEPASYYNNLLKLYKAGFRIPSDALCLSNFNSTESVRLMRELTGWVNGHKEEIQKMKQHKAPKKKKSKTPLSKHLHARYDDKVSRVLRMAGKDPSNKYQLEILDYEGLNVQPFVSELRRNDTFYVVSFNMDHVLLPATAYNKTMRPRMSLIMPAVHLNNSMLQIDCEVLGTQPVRLKESFVSAYMKDGRDRKFNSFG